MCPKNMIQLACHVKVNSQKVTILLELYRSDLRLIYEAIAISEQRHKIVFKVKGSFMTEGQKFKISLQCIDSI